MSRDKPDEPKKKWQLDQESFDRLLAWLDSDRDKAGVEFLKIRLKIENIFARRRCHIPEELADKVIYRVAKKLPEVEASYTGNKALYFYGFVEYVYLEYIRDITKPIPPPPPLPDPPDEIKIYCMEECMKKLTSEERQLLRRYYSYEGKTKIEDRKALADELGITLITLRTRAHRLKTSVGKCAKECVKQMKKKNLNDIT
jgi:hypothetical protein